MLKKSAIFLCLTVLLYNKIATENKEFAMKPSQEQKDMKKQIEKMRNQPVQPNFGTDRADKSKYKKNK